VRLLSAVLVPTLAGWNNFLAPRLSAAAYTGANAVAAGALLTAARAVGCPGQSSASSRADSAAASVQGPRPAFRWRPATPRHWHCRRSGR
jgi:hypothetical protein